MRYSSVEWTPVVPLRARRRLGFFVWHKWRLPARERSTLPPAVILNRLAADFLVLMPLGRRIDNQFNLSSKRAGNIGAPGPSSQPFFALIQSRFINTPLQRGVGAAEGIPTVFNGFLGCI